MKGGGRRRREQQLTGRPASGRLLTEVDREQQLAAAQGEAPGLLVGGCRQRRERRVRELRQRPAERWPGAGTGRAARRAALRGSDQSSFDRWNVCRVLRVGHARRVPAHLRELLDAALRGRLAQLVLGVRGEELPRRRRAPLLAHEQHRRERADRFSTAATASRSAARVSDSRSPRGAVADLVVVLADDDQPPRRACARCRSAAVVALAEPRPRAVVEEAVLAHLRERRRAARSRRSSRSSRRSAPRAGRGGSRRSTARRGRSRRASRGVISAGRSCPTRRSASAAGPGAAASASISLGHLLRAGARARCRRARARRRAAARRRGCRASHISALSMM